MNTLFSYADIIAAVAIMIVGFGFHFIGQLISVLNWERAKRLGLQEPSLAPGYYEYEHGTAMADAALGWIYGVAAVGLMLGADWGYLLAALPGAILIYHSLIAWFTENDRRRAGHGLFTNRFRAIWCGANFATGVLAFAVAWAGLSAP